LKKRYIMRFLCIIGILCTKCIHQTQTKVQTNQCVTKRCYVSAVDGYEEEI
jgi:hypothetical protein